MSTTPRIRSTIASGIGVGALLVSLAACQPDDPGPGASAFITGAEVVGQQGEVARRDGRLGDGSADGPALSVAETTTSVINGGSQLVTITASEEIVGLLVGIQAVEGATYVDPEAGYEPGPLPGGYYAIELAQPATEVELVLTLAQQLPADTFRFDYAGVAEGNRQGPRTSQDASTTLVGSGEVQVSVRWDAASDVDLYVVDPSGEEIFWRNDQGTSGGELDLDSNADCEIDNTNNENITFAEAPPGEYTVRVNYWSSCDVEQTNYVVTVQVGGQDPQTFTGELTGEGNGGAEGAGEVITTFTVAE